MVRNALFVGTKLVPPCRPAASKWDCKFVCESARVKVLNSSGRNLKRVLVFGGGVSGMSI